jgi:hypothetical protein
MYVPTVTTTPFKKNASTEYEPKIIKIKNSEIRHFNERLY